MQGFAQERTLNPVEKKLYESVLFSQIESHKYFSYVGSWPTYARFINLIDFSMTSSFESVQILLFLQQAEQFAELPYPEKLADVRERTYRLLKRYINESILTGEPRGSLNFYPFLDPVLHRRGFPSVPRDLAFKVLGYPLSDANVPNDWDCGARTYVLTHERPEMQAWTSHFPNNVSQWVDKGDRPRFELYPWKKPNSGAFLTWAEPDRLENPSSRILDQLNDVDCVVNLNILEALGFAEKKMELAPQTIEAKENSCRLINTLMSEGPRGGIQKCGVYYQRASQVLLSYARATEAMGHQSESNCLASSKNQALQIALQLAKEALRRGSPATRLERGELLISLKTLTSPEKRSPQERKIIQKLSGQIQSELEKSTASQARSMYVYRYRGWNLRFWSPAYDNSLFLYSLVRP